MLEINLLDVAVIVILLSFLARGLMRGLTREVAGLVGVVGGFALARHFQPSLEPSLRTIFADRNVAGVMAYVLIFVCSVTVVLIAAVLLRRFMSLTLTSWVDHLLGAGAGLAKGLVVLSVIFFLIQGFFPNLPLVNNAVATPFFHSMTDYLRNFLPDSFTHNLPRAL